jgi:hypothetical protein
MRNLGGDVMGDMGFTTVQQIIPYGSKEGTIDGR